MLEFSTHRLDFLRALFFVLFFLTELRPEIFYSKLLPKYAVLHNFLIATRYLL